MAAQSVAWAALPPAPACDRLAIRPSALFGLDTAQNHGEFHGESFLAACGLFLRHWRPSARKMADAFYESGAEALEKDDLDQAARHFTAALGVRGLSRAHLAFLYSERGRVFNESGDYDRAVQDLSASLRYGPQDTTTLYCRGIAYWNAGDYERSVEDFTTAIRLDPEDAALYRERGDAYRSMDRLDHAMADLDSVLKSDPEDEKAYRYRAAAHQQNGRRDLAIEDYTAAIRLAPDKAEAYLDRGWIHHMDNNYQRAIEDYSAALRIDPEDASALYGRGRALEAKGETDRARQDFEAAYRLEPDDPDYRAAYLAASPTRLISLIALALLGASALGTVGYRKRWRMGYTWGLMLTSIALSIWALASYS
ncbi:MAG: tetratricopeptide repeat protein [Rhodospirillales bacterium]|nr:tetratricopeptide repeat protein [Rhodospirillales bacterium]MDH3792473.1 tetratricopeptide repeat protein [Rhodospirillales bacterium]MDH3919967.1 tetratricopeptide repeat protein [Rhodospirillales bacterium]MDH3969493.1 tetratricopeptide repeat protein [Rhodospirillales bacterium]